MHILRIAAAIGTVALALGPAMPSSADDGDASVAHVEPGDDGGLNLLVSVPPTAAIDLDRVTVTIDGTDAEAVAEPAGTRDLVRRTAVLAIDSSNSMKGGRFTAAKQAAFAFLEQAPDDVYVGVVTFAGEVVRALEPTRDRAAAVEALRTVELSRATRLHDGVLDAVAMAGDEGQRSLLVLSDGADTSSTPLEDVTDAITASEIRVDVVGLDQSPKDLAALEGIASAGSGEVLPADREALRRIFSAEAEVLATQLLVTTEVPESVTATRAPVEIRLPSEAGDLVASAYAPVQGASITAPVDDRSLVLPTWALVAGVGAVGVGFAALLGVMLLPARTRSRTVEERVASYGGSGPGNGPVPPPETSAALGHARDAAAEVLKHNRSLEERLTRDLAAAGSRLKPTEWLLVRVGVFIAAGLLGLVLGRGSLVLGLLFLVLGAVGPWIHLRIRKARRFKAFDRALPETLQLLSGSLQAGMSLAQGVDTVVREGTEPVASEFKRVLVETRLGVGLEDAMEHLADRFGSEDFAWVVMAIRIQREVGGNLAELLDTVGNTMRERDFLRRQVGALSAEGKISALVLSVLPPGFLLYLLLTQREYVMPMFTDLRGLLMIIGGGLWLGVGIFWMSKLVKVEV